MKRTVPYAFYTAGALIVYFILMKIFGLEKNLYLRVFNFFIVGAGIFFLYRNSLKKENDEQLGYVQSLMAGGLLTLISVVVFVVFLALYIYFLDPQFLETLDSTSLWATSGMPVSLIVFGILIEGLSSGFMISFILMQYFKSVFPRHNSV